MYCSNCGKKCPDDSKFCTACGAALQQRTVSEETEVVYPVVRGSESEIVVKRFINMYLPRILAIFLGLGCFFPVIKVDLGILDRTAKGEMSLFQLMMNIEKLDDLGIFESDEMSLPALIFGICFFSYIICLVGLVSLLVKMVQAGLDYHYSGENLISLLVRIVKAVPDNHYSREKMITIFGMVPAALVFIAVTYINKYTADEFYGISIFSMTAWEWLLLAVSVINLFLLFRPDSSYLKAD